MIGVGGVGHIALQLMRELGASVTVAIDTDSRRRALASELGADEVLDGGGSVDAVRELTDGRGADLVFDFVGTDQTHADSMAMLARGGTYSIVGFGGMLCSRRRQLVVGENAVVGNLVGTWIDLWELMQLHGTDGSCSRPSRTPWTPSTTSSEAPRRRGHGRAVLVPG